MSNNRFVLLITGPSAAGKSTLARELAIPDNALVIDIESINYMFVNAFHSVSTSDGTGALEFNNWAQSGETIGLLAKHFIETGNNVIIHGHVNKELIINIDGAIHITHKVLLLPEVKSLILRDKNRGINKTMGEDIVKNHYKYFEGADFKEFVTIDSTNDGIEETVEKINNRIMIDF